MRKITHLLIWALLSLLAAPLSAQEETTADSLASMQDSLIQALRNQVQELQLQGIMMQEKIEKSGMSAREDSLRKARLKARIDSLREITPGAPLVIKGDTLLKLYNRRGGVLPEQRVEDSRNVILELGKRMSFFVDSVFVFESEYTSDIMAGNQVIISFTDNDGLWENKSRQELAKQYSTVIEAKIQELHDEYGLQQKLMGFLFVAVLILVLIVAIWGINKCYWRWRSRLIRFLLRKSKPIVIKDYEVLNSHRLGIFYMSAYNVIRYLLIALCLLICIPLIFSVFPETKSITYTIFGYIWNPFVSIVKSVVGFLPKFFQIIVIVLCFRYLVKGIRYLTNEIAEGNLQINGFYADWAKPTYYILRLLLYSFMLVMIWPLLPNSDSEIFQGVSVFIGIMISLGSSSIIGNLMAGLVMTYMRPFRVGDFIKYGDTEGFVIEKNVLVTRIRTRKNDVITVPNSNLMGSQTTNFTYSAQNYGIVVHTKVTIGYDMPWQQIRQLLLDAAKATKGLKQHPEPFVLVTTLDDFYVEYEINAYTTDYNRLPIIYSELHHHILDTFHSNGVEIMSPHIYAHRSDLETQIPKQEAEHK